MVDPGDYPTSDPRGNPDCRIRPTRARHRWTPARVGLTCVKFTAVLVTLAVVAAGVLVVRMSAGPIAIEGLGDRITAALHERFGDSFRFEVGGTSLVQHGFGPSLAIDRMSVSGPDGAPILVAPKAEISIDTFALLFGRVVPKRLEVFDVTLRAVLQKSGTLAVAAGDGTKPLVEMGRGGDASPAPPPAAAPDAAPATGDLARSDGHAEIMRKAAAGIRQFLDILTDPQSPIAAVDRLGISRGTLVIADQETEAETTYKDLELAFDKRRGTTNFDLSADGPVRRWTIAATAKGTPGRARSVSVKVQDLSIDELKLAAGSRSLGVDTDAPIGMGLDLALNADNSLSEAAGSVALGPGYLQTEDPDQEPIFISTIDSRFHWDGAKREIVVDRTRYLEGGTHVDLAGKVLPPRAASDPWKVALSTTEPGLLAPDRKGQQAIPVERGSFDGELELGRKTFLIRRLAFKTDKGGMAMAGSVDWIDGPRIRLGIAMDPTPIQTVERIWPASMGAAVRAWVLGHFEAGTIEQGTLKIDYDQTALQRIRADRAPADAAMSIDFKVSGGRLRYLDGVPPIENAKGSAHITGRTTHITVDSATSDANGRPIELSQGSFVVDNSDIHPAHAQISAHLAGSVEAVTDILSRDALKPYASLPLDPTTLHGQVEGDLTKAIVLGPNADPAQEPLTVTSKITGFTAEHLVGKESLEDANLTINVADGKLKAAGQGRLFGGPATFEIDREGTGEPQATIAVTLDDAARGKLGLPAIPGVSGPMTAHVAASLGDPAKLKAQVDLDLAKTSIAAAYLGLSKPAGKAAKIGFTLTAGSDRMRIDPIALDVGTVQGHGAIDLSADNAFEAAHFPVFKVSTGDDMKLDVVKKDDMLKLTVRGSTIDARPFLKALTSTPTDDATPMSRSAKSEKKEVEAFKGFDVDLKSGILTGFNKEVMSGVDLKLSKRGSAIRQFSVQGRFGREAVSGSMSSNGRLRIAAQDAGALVSFIDLYKHMEGGQLTSTMQMDEDALSGNLEIHDFVLRDEPAIRRLVATSATVSAPGDDTAAARRIDAGAVDFKRLKVNFQRAGSRLELHDATMYGPQIGLSVDGWLDYSHDRVGMKGTFVPAYAINNLFAQIPVFGLFLGGKSNEGLLAITFNIAGQASSPTLSINPLSAIAPGFLREIFGVLDQPVPQQGAAAPSR